LSMAYDPDLPLYLGIDFGYRNPFACLWLQPVARGERVLVLNEYYQRLRTTAENGRALLAQHIAWGYGPITAVYPDPSNPEGAAVLAEILGVPVSPLRRSVAEGQELVRQWLKVRPDGKPGLLIHHGCKNLIRELTYYLKHEPGQGEHHAVDALRYFFAGWPGAW